MNRSHCCFCATVSYHKLQKTLLNHALSWYSSSSSLTFCAFSLSRGASCAPTQRNTGTQRTQITKHPYWPRKSRHHLTQWSPQFDQSFMHHLQMPKAKASLTLLPLHNYPAARSSSLQWSRGQHVFAHFPWLQCLPLLIMISCEVCEFWVLQGFSWQLTKPEANTDFMQLQTILPGFLPPPPSPCTALNSNCLW